MAHCLPGRSKSANKDLCESEVDQSRIVSNGRHLLAIAQSNTGFHSEADFHAKNTLEARNAKRAPVDATCFETFPAAAAAREQRQQVALWLSRLPLCSRLESSSALFERGVVQSNGTDCALLRDRLQ